MDDLPAEMKQNVNKSSCCGVPLERHLRCRILSKEVANEKLTVSSVCELSSLDSAVCFSVTSVALLAHSVAKPNRQRSLSPTTQMPVLTGPKIPKRPELRNLSTVLRSAGIADKYIHLWSELFPVSGVVSLVDLSCVCVWGGGVLIV